MVLTICASGFSSSDTTAIECQVVSLCGHFSKDLTDTVDLLICSKANSAKYSMCTDVLKKPVVTKTWLDASVKQGSFVEDYGKYKVKPLTGVRLFVFKAGKETKKAVKSLGSTVVGTMDEAEITVTNVLAIRRLPRFYVEDVVVGEQWVAACQKEGKEVSTAEFLLPRPQLPADQNLFLSKCIIFLNVAKDAFDPLKSLIAMGGGTWAKTMMRCVTHVVADHKCDAGRAVLVSKKWLETSVHDGMKKDEGSFPVKEE